MPNWVIQRTKNNGATSGSILYRVCCMGHLSCLGEKQTAHKHGKVDLDHFRCCLQLFDGSDILYFTETQTLLEEIALTEFHYSDIFLSKDMPSLR